MAVNIGQDRIGTEELDGQCARRAIAELSKFLDGPSYVIRVGDQNLLPRASPCFGRHVKLLVPAAFAVVSTHSKCRQAASRKNNCRIFITA
jgi:hypothetical protein